MHVWYPIQPLTKHLLGFTLIMLIIHMLHSRPIIYWQGTIIISQSYFWRKLYQQQMISLYEVAEIFKTSLKWFFCHVWILSNPTTQTKNFFRLSGMFTSWGLSLLTICIHLFKVLMYFVLGNSSHINEHKTSAQVYKGIENH